MRVRSVITIAVTGSALSLLAAGSLAAPGRAATRPAAPHATRYVTAGQLVGVAAASASSAWAVGFSGNGTPKTLLVHWNGSGWSKVTRPAVVNGATGMLTAIAVVSQKNAWAVGSTGAHPNEKTLILHWNGTSWSAVTSLKPFPGQLQAVAATSGGAWAVGSTGAGAGQPLILRFNGRAWSRVAAPADPLGADLNSVAITGASAAWAAGPGSLNAQITGRLARWNGRSWSWVAKFPVQGTYHYLTGLAAGPNGTAWAVGDDASRSTVPLSMRWTGSAWAKMPTALTLAAPDAVTVAPGGTPWLSGSVTGGGGARTLIARWTGKAWRRVASPSPAALAELYAVGFAAAKNGWAVGATNLGSAPRTLVLHWNGTAWG